MALTLALTLALTPTITLAFTLNITLDGGCAVDCRPEEKRALRPG